MRGRAKANRENIIILAHQIEAMARQKKFKPDVQDYLKLAAVKKSVGTDPGVFNALEKAAAKGLVTIKERTL